ncbi:BgTH12-02799 [Blumeria graminis f. sp. triticale]|uniref:Bgt-4337 n=3 Tax=Blumeria graminis TaxID=34373 RepID=A0A381LBF3_BLUGR|nr:hypothetical protein BGT96224_4337 [Blumeria graminis f. sp. tritici 96224]CAD6503130.1 BgTH12-02799 [Blumeria graminis f. sp. triticale]VDB89077.1 Bgt-4337 [Blumeria graminis f. sp. tritici]
MDHRPQSATQSPSSHPNLLSRSQSPFPAKLQDRQARNKDMYSSSEDDCGYIDDSGLLKRPSKESYEAIQMRREAAIILDTPELLFMYAQARGDSLAGTRHHFTKMHCGYLDQENPTTTASEKSPLRGKDSRR